MNHDLRQAFDNDRVPTRAADLWGVPTDALGHIRSGQSFVYAFTAGADRGVIKITSRLHRSPELVESELAFVDYLRGRGLPVVEPLRSRRGNLVETLETPVGGVSVTAFRHLDVEPDLRGMRKDPERLYRELGRIAGSIHFAAKSYEPAGLRRPRWDEDWPLGGGDIFRYLPDAASRDEYHTLVEAIRALPETRDSFGLIHRDISENNIGFAGDRLALFDFDQCCYHWFCFELAKILGKVSEEPEPHRKRQFAALLAGYREKNELPPDYRDQINLFWRWHVLLGTVSPLNRMDDVLVAPWDENRRRQVTFPLDSLPPWDRNRRRQRYSVLFGRLRW